MNIRQANCDDAEKLLDFLSAFWADRCNTVVYMSSLPTLEQERKWLSSMNADGAVFIYEDDGKIAGMIDVSVPKADEFRHTCEFGMSVLSEFRNKGIGRKLILHILNWAEDSGLCKVELNVFSNNIPGIALYSSLGFIEDGRRKNAIKLKDGTFCDLVHMSRYTEKAVGFLHITENV